MTDISGSNTVSDGSNGLYTPTTEEVRESYVLMQKCSAYPNPDAEFDRWFAEVKAEAVAQFIDATGVALDAAKSLMAKAWEEGYNAKWVETYFEDNPYRQGETE